MQMANTLCFPEGIGGVHKTCGNSGVVGVIFVFKNMEIPGRRGGLAWNSLRGGGMDI